MEKRDRACGPSVRPREREHGDIGSIALAARCPSAKKEHMARDKMDGTTEVDEKINRLSTSRQLQRGKN